MQLVTVDPPGYASVTVSLTLYPKLDPTVMFPPDDGKADAARVVTLVPAGE